MRSTGSRFAAIVGITMSALMLSSCFIELPPEIPGDQVDAIPSDAVGVVTLGGGDPKSLGALSLTYFFGEGGELLGYLGAPDTGGNAATVFDGGIAAVSGEAISILSPDGKIDVPMENSTVDVSVTNSEQVAYWFDAQRSSQYVIVDAAGEVTRGSLPGMAHSATYCGDTLFTVVRDIDVGPSDYRLLEMPAGTPPSTVGTWTLPTDVRFTTRSLHCHPNGTSVVSVTSTVGHQGPTKPVLTLIDTADGRISTFDIDAPLETVGEFRGGEIGIVDDVLVWLTDAGEVMATTLADTISTRRLWTMPNFDSLSSAVSIDGRRVTVLDTRGVPTFDLYDLITGERTMSTVTLPWLEPLVGTDVAHTIYTVSGAAPIEP